MKNKRSFITTSTFFVSALCGVITGTFSFLTNFVLGKLLNKNKGRK
jgi:hypothetical protein